MPLLCPRRAQRVSTRLIAPFSGSEDAPLSVDRTDRPIQWLKREDAPTGVDDATVDRVNRIIVWKRGAEAPTKVDDVSVDRVNRIIVW
ncbi:unnamed protein product [Clonostachys chloroleuca]|uniref:Uncharacterized protein n=1 Tax=Clonostachys chloroleuca TaxID=1926264 RepID=A0AA35LUB6_9HYPO|nr:unnamed protein product [Clonostachys chloroleuca]